MCNSSVGMEGPMEFAFGALVGGAAAWLATRWAVVSSTASQTSHEVSAAGRLVTARASKERLGEGDGQTLS